MTVKSYLNKLPRSVREAALENVKAQQTEYLCDREVTGLYEAVCGAFAWHNTPQGFECWMDIALHDYSSPHVLAHFPGIESELKRERNLFFWVTLAVIIAVIVIAVINFNISET